MKSLSIKNWILCCALILASFAMYGRSLPYGFVYDDYTKYAHNPSLGSFREAIGSFHNPNAQSLGESLNRDIYRPLFVLQEYVDHRLWHDNVVALRAQNIFIHGVNAAMLVLLAQLLFEIPLFAAGVGAFFFLLHPTNVESVVWITERSNVIVHFLILLSLISWILYRTKKERSFSIFSFVLFGAGLFYRETAAVIPLLFFSTDWIFFSERSEGRRKIILWPLLMGGLILLSYLSIRLHVLHQIGQNPFWGGSLKTNLIYVFSQLGNYLRSLVWASPLTIQHGEFNIRPPVLLPWATAFFTLVFVMAALFLTHRKNQKCFLLLIWILIFWLPTSNLFPLRVLFADRFIYSPLIPFSLLIGLVLSELGLRSNLSKSVFLVFIAALISINIFRTLQYIPVWKNDRELWLNAIRINPDDSMAWAKIADFEFSTKNENTNSTSSIYFAEDAYKRSLKIGLPVGWAGYAFLRLAEINLMENKPKMAQEHAARALMLRPDLKSEWEEFQNKFRGF